VNEKKANELLNTYKSVRKAIDSHSKWKKIYLAKVLKR
jgi:hypothetical protein